MAFDIKTARPVYSGFDINTARPIEEPQKKSIRLKDILASYNPVRNKNFGMDIISGMAAPKAVNEMASQIQSINRERLQPSIEDILKPMGNRASQPLVNKAMMLRLLSRNPSPMSAGMYAGSQSTPRGAVEAGADVLSDPRTYLPTGKTMASSKPMTTVGEIMGRGSKGLSNILSKPAEYLSKSSADYVTQKIAPEAYQSYLQGIKKFTPEIQNFAREELKIPENALNTIKKKGVDYLDNIRQKMGDSTDDIFRRIQEGFLNKKQFADDAYNTAIEAIPSETIDTVGTMRKLSNIVKDRLNLVDEIGKPTRAYDRASAPYKRLADMYMDLKNPVTAKGGKVSGYPLTKEQWAMWRDELGNLIKERPSDRVVMDVRNSLYNDAENELRLVEKTTHRKMPSLKEARNLESEAINTERLFSNKFKEGQLDKFHNLTEQQVRDLKTIEKYIGDNFVSDLDDLTSARELDKFKKVNLETFQSDLNQAIDRKWTEAARAKYSKLLGKESADKLINDVISHRRGKILKKGAIAAGSISGAEATRRAIFR